MSLTERTRPVKTGNPEEKFSATDSGEVMEIDSLSGRVRTVAEALKKGDVDQAVWEVDKFTLNSWEVGMKFGSKAEERVVTSPLWQVKVWLRRKVSRAVEIASAALWERMRAHSPKLQEVKYASRIKDAAMLEISPFDVHFGKLAWHGETEEDYDLKIAERVFGESFETILGLADLGQVEKILIPFGNDFLHVDNAHQTTGNDTPQDVDGRYPKMIEIATMAMVRAVERCRQVAPVHITWVPGNHDPRTSWHVAHFLSAWFRNAKGVTIDIGATPRKYVRYGSSLLGFTHGNEEKRNSLPLIMAGERKKDWSECSHHEWHLGHLHKRMETHHTACDTFGPVVVRTLPSMSLSDLWHYKKGFVGGPRGAEAYLYSKADGPIATYFAPVKINDRKK